MSTLSDVNHWAVGTEDLVDHTPSLELRHPVLWSETNPNLQRSQNVFDALRYFMDME